jgi:8-oxo-dGTP diphosphatase
MPAERLAAPVAAAAAVLMSAISFRVAPKTSSTTVFAVVAAVAAAGVAAAATSVARRRRAAPPPSSSPDAFEFKIRPVDGKSYGVGVCVFILSPTKHPGCILLGRRRGSDGSGTFALPGGHLEFGESPITCAERETLEETGLAIRKTKCIGVCNAVELDEQYHYVTPVCVGLTDEEPVNLEPNKCDGWAWVRWDDPAFPQPLFSGLRKIRASGFDPVASPAQTVVFVE